MITKIFEVRGYGYLIPVIATKLETGEPHTDYLLKRGGMGDGYTFILLTDIHKKECQVDPYKWQDTRTMFHAHKYIRDNFDTLKNAEVIDVEYILGETPVKKSPYVPTDENYSEIRRRLKVLDKPYTHEEIKKLTNNGKEYIEGVVALDLSSAIGHDIEAFLDEIALLLVNSELLMDIGYEVVGSEGDTIFLKVTGDITKVVDFYDEDEELEE